MTLAVPAAIAYDPYAWLVWGRQIGRLTLDTTGGPSWKPLPVLVTTVIGPFDGLAPALWLVVARTAALLAIVGVFRIATRLAGAWAGVLAVGAFVLSPDPGPRYVRLFLEGHSAPLTAALAVWAVDRHLDGKHGTALVLGALLALDRPEAWPFLAVYALWCWRRAPGRRPLVVTACVAVPLLWFAPDWWGSGSPLHGADSARVLAEDSTRIVDGLRRLGELVVPPAWAAALLAVVDAWRRRDRTVLVLAAGAGAWLALVVAMSAALGYAALSRFLLPGAAIVCVLAGVGAVRLVDWFPAGRARAVAVVVLVLLALPTVVWRSIGIGGQLDEVADRDHQVADLDRAIAAVGPAGLACGRIAVHDAGVPRVALAWKLDEPLARIRTRPGRTAGVVFVPRRPESDPDRRAARLARRSGSGVETAAVTEHWMAFRVGCDPGGPGSGAVRPSASGDGRGSGG